MKIKLYADGRHQLLEARLLGDDPSPDILGNQSFVVMKSTLKCLILTFTVSQLDILFFLNAASLAQLDAIVAECARSLTGSTQLFTLLEPADACKNEKYQKIRPLSINHKTNLDQIHLLRSIIQIFTRISTQKPGYHLIFHLLCKTHWEIISLTHPQVAQHKTSFLGSEILIKANN